MIIKPSRKFEGSDLHPITLLGHDFKSAIEEILGSVIWISDTEGFCTCPGAHLHTTKDSTKDCKLYIQSVPTLRCFHSSCSVIVEETTRHLRRLARDTADLDTAAKKALTTEQKAQMALVRARESLRRQAAATKHRILRDFAWTYEQIQMDSPEIVPSNPGTHWRDQLSLFDDGDVVWIGDIYHSGKPEHAGRFKTRREWLDAYVDAPAPFTCGSTFQVGSFSRANANLVRRAYLVVESDELDKNTIGSVFRWMRDKAGMKLRCIVDTAGKSLHGWFDFPPEDELNDLRIVLPELGCDPKMFTASQPCRLAGAIRDGRYQKLIYLQRGEQK